MEKSKFSQYGELKCSLLKPWVCSLVLRIAISLSLSHSFILVLLTEHLLCASTVLDTSCIINEYHRERDRRGPCSLEAHIEDDPHDFG